VQRIWANAQRNWPNARTFGTRARDLPNVAKLVNAARLTNWSNALRDCANAQIGQMRLTVTQYSFLIP